MKVTTPFFALARGNHIQREVNSECPSFDESSACANDCENANIACIINCENDTHCVVFGFHFLNLIFSKSMSFVNLKILTLWKSQLYTPVR